MSDPIEIRLDHLETRVDLTAKEVEDLDDRTRRMETAMEHLTEGVVQLRSDLAGMDAKLAGLATRRDLDGAINGILGRALDAVPQAYAGLLQQNSLSLQRRALFWQVFAALVFGAGFAVTVARGLGEITLLLHGNR